jgi:hypothetical protein
MALPKVLKSQATDQENPNNEASFNFHQDKYFIVVLFELRSV